ncbi:MAG: hypothetical protein KDA84_09360 [Planctomycetaceae bacterium]|nr:hypothetical protein [Planctomycetaceae bacterium]
MGPYSSGEGPGVYPQLLDLINEDRNVMSFTKEFQINHQAPPHLLAISEIDTFVGLFYAVTTDAVFCVDLDLNFQDLLEGSLLPRWRSSEEFLSDFFRGLEHYFSSGS